MAASDGKAVVKVFYYYYPKLKLLRSVLFLIFLGYSIKSGYSIFSRDLGELSGLIFYAGLSFSSKDDEDYYYYEEDFYDEFSSSSSSSPSELSSLFSSFSLIEFRFAIVLLLLNNY